MLVATSLVGMGLRLALLAGSGPYSLTSVLHFKLQLAWYSIRAIRPTYPVDMNSRVQRFLKMKKSPLSVAR